MGSAKSALYVNGGGRYEQPSVSLVYTVGTAQCTYGTAQCTVGTAQCTFCTVQFSGQYTVQL